MTRQPPHPRSAPGAPRGSRTRTVVTVIAFVLVVGSLGAVVAAAFTEDADVRLPLGIAASVALVLGLALGVAAVVVRRPGPPRG